MADERQTAELRVIQEHKTLKDGFNLLLKRSEESKAKVAALEGESEVEVERLQAQITRPRATARWALAMAPRLQGVRRIPPRIKIFHILHAHNFNCPRDFRG